MIVILINLTHDVDQIEYNTKIKENLSYNSIICFNYLS